ncbi:MAG: S8 family serine peptidase [Bacillota bacterium]
MKIGALLKIGRVLFIFVFAAFVYAGCSDDPARSEEYVPGNVIVGWADTVKYEFAKSFIDQSKLEQLRWSFDSPLKYTLVKVPEGQEKAWVIYFKRFPFVKYAELDAVMHAY